MNNSVQRWFTISKHLRAALLFMVVSALTFSLVSCGDNNDDVEEPIYHLNEVHGKVSTYNVAVNEANADISADKSNYRFISTDYSDAPQMFDWEVKLVETKDSLMTLHLHIDDIKRTNCIIYSPNDEDAIRTKTTCYITVTDVKNKVTTVYHPTHPAPIILYWNIFMVSDEGNGTVRRTMFPTNNMGYGWPGIEGHLHGTLTSDNEETRPIPIDIRFSLY